VNAVLSGSADHMLGHDGDGMAGWEWPGGASAPIATVRLCSPRPVHGPIADIDIRRSQLEDLGQAIVLVASLCPPVQWRLPGGAAESPRPCPPVRQLR